MGGAVMSHKICQRCGRELTQAQRWRHSKFCSRSCFHDVQFGERIEWNGVWIRPGQALEVLKLCEKGLSESEARKAVGADFKAMQRLRNTPEFAVFLPERICLHCGKSLSQYPLVHKYCSKSCNSKATYDRQCIAEGRETTQRIDPAKRNRAIDLFARGLDSVSIARYLGVPAQKTRNWVYARRIKRSLDLCPELMSLLPLKHRLDRAESATEWRSILHDASKSFGTPGLVILATETLHGSGAPGRYATIVLEQLKRNPTEGGTFAFCNVLRNAITVLEWKDGNWSLSRTLKSSGTFLWPRKHLGNFVTVTQAAFSYLISYQKNAKPAGFSLEKP